MKQKIKKFFYVVLPCLLATPFLFIEKSLAKSSHISVIYATPEVFACGGSEPGSFSCFWYRYGGIVLLFTILIPVILIIALIIFILKRHKKHRD